MKTVTFLLGSAWLSGITAQALLADSATSFVLEAGKQVPALLVLVWLTAKFLNQIKDMDDRRAAREATRDEVVQTLGKQCHQFQHDLAQRSETMMERVSDIMEENTKMSATVMEAMRHTNETLDHTNRVLDRMETK